MDKATKHEEPIILSEAQTQLDDWGKEWPHESYRISTYRRVKKV